MNTNHIKQINRWLAKRDLKPIDPTEMPATSFIIPGVAACGIRVCEGQIGILDSVVTNPHASKQVRNAALNQLFEHAIAHPGFKRLMGFSIDKHTLERAERHGFKAMPHLIMSLSKES